MTRNLQLSTASISHTRRGSHVGAVLRKIENCIMAMASRADVNGENKQN